VEVQDRLGTDMLDLLLPFRPQKVEPQAVNVRVDQVAHLLLDPDPARRIDFQFEDRELHALAVVLTHLCNATQPPWSANTGRTHVIAHQNHHEGGLTSIEMEGMRPDRRAGDEQAVVPERKAPSRCLFFRREKRAAGLLAYAPDMQSARSCVLPL
jgi:hypothetical protein